MTYPTPFPRTPERPRHGIATRILVASCVALLVAGYAALAVLTRGLWLGTTETVDDTRVVFAAVAPDGTDASADDLDTARDILASRVDDLGATENDVSIDGDTLVVQARGPDESAVRGLGTTGYLYIRPVLHVIPAAPLEAPATTKTPDPPPADLAQQLKDEKALRQSEDLNIQALAMQFQASRCGNHDVLAGQDDPALPLVTCSDDDAEVYLVAPSIIDGSEIDDATSAFDRQIDQYLVDLEFDADAADTWADFTAANIGTQTAFTIDTVVVSAPEIREAIPGGRTQISGGFTEDSARELAGVLESGPLPVALTVESSSSESDTVTTSSTPWRIGLGIAGLLLIGIVVGSIVYLVSASRRREGIRTT